MTRKVTLLGIAVTAFAAIVMPAVASASPRLMEGSSAVSEGATVVATSKNLVITNTALGTVECKNWAFWQEVEKNTGFEIETSGYGETFACNASGEFANVTLATMSLFTALGWNDEGLVYPSLIVDVGPFECPYSGVSHFTYTTGGDTISVKSGILQSPYELCEPEAFNPGFEGDFTLTTGNGVPVTIK